MREMRYLGIDYGSKKTGLALSDGAGTMGFPYATVSTTPALAQEISALIAERGVGAIVIGGSFNNRGEENPIAREARALGDSLKERTGLPVFYEPEFYTSAEARRQYAREGGRSSRAPRIAHRNTPIDASAAAIILTAYLSRLSHE